MMSLCLMLPSNSSLLTDAFQGKKRGCYITQSPTTSRQARPLSLLSSALEVQVTDLLSLTYGAGRADLPLASPPGSSGIPHAAADAADLGSTAVSRWWGGGGHRYLLGSLHETALCADMVSPRTCHGGGETGQVLAECRGKPSRSVWVNWWINPPESVGELSLSWLSSTIRLQPISCHPFWTLWLVASTQQGDIPEIWAKAFGISIKGTSASYVGEKNVFELL